MDAVVPYPENVTHNFYEDGGWRAPPSLQERDNEQLALKQSLNLTYSETEKKLRSQGYTDDESLNRQWMLPGRFGWVSKTDAVGTVNTKASITDKDVITSPHGLVSQKMRLHYFVFDRGNDIGGFPCYTRGGRGMSGALQDPFIGQFYVRLTSKSSATANLEGGEGVHRAVKLTQGSVAPETMLKFETHWVKKCELAKEAKLKVRSLDALRIAQIHSSLHDNYSQFLVASGIGSQEGLAKAMSDLAAESEQVQPRLKYSFERQPGSYDTPFSDRYCKTGDPTDVSFHSDMVSKRGAAGDTRRSRSGFDSTPRHRSDRRGSGYDVRHGDRSRSPHRNAGSGGIWDLPQEPYSLQLDLSVVEPPSGDDGLRRAVTNDSFEREAGKDDRRHIVHELDLFLTMPPFGSSTTSPAFGGASAAGSSAGSGAVHSVSSTSVTPTEISTKPRIRLRGKGGKRNGGSNGERSLTGVNCAPLGKQRDFASSSTTIGGDNPYFSGYVQVEQAASDQNARPNLKHSDTHQESEDDDDDLVDNRAMGNAMGDERIDTTPTTIAIATQGNVEGPHTTRRYNDGNWRLAYDTSVGTTTNLGRWIKNAIL